MPTLSCGDIVIQEGTSGDITCTLTNSTSGDITIGSPNPFSISLTGPVGPDSTDVATVSGFSGFGSPACTAGETLSAGKSCGFAVDFTTDKRDAEPDLPGVNSFLINVNSTFHGPIFTTANVKVEDPFTAPVPEPASVFLLCSGLLGVFGLLRRKLL